MASVDVSHPTRDVTRQGERGAQARCGALRRLALQAMCVEQRPQTNVPAELHHYAQLPDCSLSSHIAHRSATSLTLCHYYASNVIVDSAVAACEGRTGGGGCTLEADGSMSTLSSSPIAGICSQGIGEQHPNCGTLHGTHIATKPSQDRTAGVRACPTSLGRLSIRSGLASDVYVCTTLACFR